MQLFLFIQAVIEICRIKGESKDRIHLFVFLKVSIIKEKIDVLFLLKHCEAKTAYCNSGWIGLTFKLTK